jgi:hypothetical protein
MQDYIKASQEIKEYINSLTNDTVPTVCKMLDEFWRLHCEKTKSFLFFYYTSHNHAAKGTWATLDHQLRLRIKELKNDGG